MSTGNELPDKNYLYGEFQRTQRWRDKLARKLAHKSLDIGDEDEMNVANVRTGIGWKELAVLAATGLGGLWLYNEGQGKSDPSPPPAAAASPVDSEYEVRFFDAKGNPIYLPQHNPNSQK